MDLFMDLFLEFFLEFFLLEIFLEIFLVALFGCVVRVSFPGCYPFGLVLFLLLLGHLPFPFLE